ncbi:MAG: hypothetical protein CR982_05445 [Candidatus Cloacimonadota bacterium]|nr:MAG: hypothetical protein CR982_05445 [Candidatus Cloacimonadota bacterium]PIE77588.1 MAG: hypothetical protein CSA15_12180 [Candidatus Delongbacteria bacterium]
MFDISKFTVEKARPIPVILLLDVSGSMSGEKIAQLNKAVADMLQEFKTGGALETEIQMSVITFGGDVKLALPLISASNISTIHPLIANGGTPMGTALRMAKEMIEDKEIIPSKGYRPTVVLISDGAPTDNWKEPMNAFISSGRSSKCDRMAMSIGTSQDDPVLNQFVTGTENKVFLAEYAKNIPQFFRMVTMSVSVRSRSQNPNKLIPFNEVKKLTAKTNLTEEIKALNDFSDF